MSRGGSAAFPAKKIADDALPMADVTLETGSKVLWSKHDKKTVPVVCGCHIHEGQRERRLKIASVLVMMSTPESTGYCHRCSLKLPPKNNKLRSGVMQLKDGYVDFDNRDDEGKPWVFCNVCNDGRHQKPPYAKGATGRCRKHQKLKIVDEPHHTGSIIHWSRRDPKNSQRIAFTCHGCKLEKFTHETSIRYPGWSGLCVECRDQRTHHRQHTGTEKVGCLNATLDWDDRDAKNKPAITCPLADCGKKWYAAISTIANGRAKPDWTACCPEHYVGKNLLMSKIARQRASGRPPKITSERLRAEAKKIKGKPTQARLAKRLQVCESAIRKFLRRQRLTWKQIKEI